MIANSISTVDTTTDMIELVNERKIAWRSGQTPDAASTIREHPTLLRHRSLVIDLAYEEYCLLEEAGRTPDTESFCASLPAYRSQVREVIRGHRELADHPELLTNSAGMWPEVGDDLDGLPLIRELGRGGFARVYLATDPNAGNRPVVLKVSQIPSTEASTLGPIDHPNVVRVYWAKQIDGWFVICMPFVAVTTLQDAIEACRLEPSPTASTLLNVIDSNLDQLPLPSSPLEPVLRKPSQNLVASVIAIAAPLAGAIAFLHRHQICHGDLKPSNILLGRGGMPYLIDFNLASAIEASGARLGGTIPYMAPERIRALLDREFASDHSKQADVYSFGAVLFELLTGQLPYALAKVENVRQFATDLFGKKCIAPPSLQTLNAAVPKWLSRLIESCLDPNPNQRPSAELVERTLVQKSRPTSRSKWVVAASALLVVGIAAPWALSEPPQSVYEIPHVHVKKSPAQIADPFERGVAYLKAGEIGPAMSAFDEARRKAPDGRTYAYLAYCHSHEAQHAVAIDYYRKAIEAGFDEPWVRNNRAYSLTQIKRDPDSLAIALADVSQAKSKSPQQRGIQFNWTYIRFLKGYNSTTKQFRDDECLAELEKVMAHGPYDADLCYKAGMMLAAGSDAEDRRRQAIQYLIKAIELGKHPISLARDPVLHANFGNRNDFRELSALPPGKAGQGRLRLGLISPAE